MNKEFLIPSKNDMEYNAVVQLLNESNLAIERVKRIHNTPPIYKSIFKDNSTDLYIIDLTCQVMSVYEALDYIKGINPDIPVIMIKEEFSIDEALKLGRAGIGDLVEKKYVKSKLIRSIKSIIEQKNELKKKINPLDLNSGIEKVLNNHIINSLPGIFFVIDKRGQVLSVNNRFREQFIYDSESDNHYTKYVSEKDLQKSLESFDRTFQNTSDENELYLKTKDGNYVPYLISCITTNVQGATILLGTGVDISDRKEVEKKLSDERAFVSKALNSLPGLFYVLDEKLNYIRVNDNFIELLGYSWEEIQQMNPLDFYLEEDHQRITKAIEKAFIDGTASITAKIKTKNGNHPFFYLTGSCFKQDGKNYILGTGIDVTKNKIAEEKIKQSLQEKEVLLAEVHHRVKNNLAVISGLMQLQAFQADDEKIYKYLNENQSRIKSIALIHDQLYQNHNFPFVRMDEQTSKLIKYISDSINSENDIHILLNLAKVELNINQAVPISLIINEIISNAYKHAFNGKVKGQITVTLSKKEKLINLTIEDNGIGLPDEINIESPKTLGMTLIRTLTDQVRGTISIVSNNTGTAFCLQFEKKQHLKGASSHYI